VRRRRTAAAGSESERDYFVEPKRGEEIYGGLKPS
jgi:hypothetical protein